MRPPSGIVTLMTDFGVRDPYVGVMKGMVKREHPRADVIDLCHEVPPQDLAVGAFFARAAIGRFPAGTVHVGVVDPGVGSNRGMVGVFAHDCYWIGPDNGLFSEVLETAKDPVVRSIDIDALGLPEPSRTFHGRDVFAPLAGRISSGRYGFPSLGRRIEDPVRLAAGPRDPHVFWVDWFGNLVTNVPRADLGDATHVTIAGRSVPIHGTYAEAEAGEVLALINSYELLEIAVRDGRADEILGVGRGASVSIGDDS